MSTGIGTNINIRVNGDVKNKAQEVFSSLGMDMTTAVNVFLRQAIRTNGIPFELTADNLQPTKGLTLQEPSEQDRASESASGAMGIFSQYANPDIIHLEKEAWGMAVKEKHDVH